MKIQDLFFFIIFASLIYKSNPRLAAIVGILSLLASVPLFSLWVFFTAERLVWYGASFFLLCIFQYIRLSKSLK